MFIFGVVMTWCIYCIFFAPHQSRVEPITVRVHNVAWPSWGEQLNATASNEVGEIVAAAEFSPSEAVTTR